MTLSTQTTAACGFSRWIFFFGWLVGLGFFFLPLTTQPALPASIFIAARISRCVRAGSAHCPMQTAVGNREGDTKEQEKKAKKGERANP